jgi:hypothetical protein
MILTSQDAGSWRWTSTRGKHPKARIAHRGICAIPDTIFGSHSYDFHQRGRQDRLPSRGLAGRPALDRRRRS